MRTGQNWNVFSMIINQKMFEWEERKTTEKSLPTSINSFIYLLIHAHFLSYLIPLKCQLRMLRKEAHIWWATW